MAGKYDLSGIDGVNERTNWVVGTIITWVRRNRFSLLVIAATLVAWQVYAVYFNPRGNIYFPSIGFTIEQTMVYQDQILTGIVVTAKEVVAGWLASVVVGIVVGIIVAESFTIRQASMPGLIFFYSLPHAIMAPIFILWFGFSIVGISLFVAWYGFFPVLISTITGFNQVDEEFEQLGEVIEASRWQMIRKIKFWVALPHITSGVKIAVQFSIVGAIVAEFLVSTGGLGRLIVQASNLARTGLMFGVLIILMLFAILFYKLVEGLIDTFVPNA